jgi:hypothetical protein
MIFRIHDYNQDATAVSHGLDQSLITTQIVMAMQTGSWLYLRRDGREWGGKPTPPPSGL